MSREAGPEKSRNIALIDAAFVIGISVLYVILEALGIAKRLSFLAAGLVLIAYLAYLLWKHPHTWRELGFRGDNLRAGLGPVAAFTLIGGLALLGWGLATGHGRWDSQVLVLLALYPIWAVAQQLAFQGLLHRSLECLIPSPILQVLLTAAAFAAVHVGRLSLVALTFVAGLAWSWLYRRWPNIWLLAASHTILAALAYPLVLADKPLSRL